MGIEISWETNHEIKINIFTCFWYWCWKNLFLNVKLKPLANIFFSVLWTLKNFAILRIKKRLQHRCFPVDFAKFLRTPIFYLQWLLLKFISHHTKEMLYVRGSLHALFHPGLKFPRSEISPWGEIFFVYMDLSPRGEIYTFSPRDETFIVFTLGWI